MTALIALALIGPWKAFEFVEPQANGISIQALVSLPKLGAKDMAKLEIIAGAIPKQTLEYPRREMLMVTGGEPAKCEITPDLLRMVVNVPPDKLKAGIGVMESLVRDATLTQENLDAAAQELPVPDYWSAALNPFSLPAVKVKADEAQALYHRVLRPERILLIVGGKFASGDAQQEWARRMERWTAGKEQTGYFDISAPADRDRNPGPVTTIDLAVAPLAAGDSGLPSKILALYALGTGKGSSLFRVVRERLGWSYRQEAVLSPTRDGWLPRLLIACIPTADMAERVKTIKANLLDDISSWTPATRDRAIGMAKAVLINQVPFNPLYVLGNSPVGNSLEDRTFLAGYWQLKTGNPWDPVAIFESMKQVSLDDLKEQATSMLTTEIPRVLPGG